MDPLLLDVMNNLKALIDEKQENSKIEKNSEIEENSEIFNVIGGANASLESYLSRFIKFCGSNIFCFYLSLFYIYKLVNNEKIVVTDKNVYKLFLASFTISIKYVEDSPNDQIMYKVGGIDPCNLNALVRMFLEMIVICAFN